MYAVTHGHNLHNLIVIIYKSNWPFFDIFSVWKKEGKRKKGQEKIHKRYFTMIFQKCKQNKLCIGVRIFYSQIGQRGFRGQIVSKYSRGFFSGILLFFFGLISKNFDFMVSNLNLLRPT